MARTHFTPSRVPVLLAALVIGFLLLLATASAATGSSVSPPEPTPYLVQAGDTLWSVAEAAYGPEADTRQAVYSIKRLNGLPGAGLAVGQVLLLPAG
jgi:LysM repeat protein